MIRVKLKSCLAQQMYRFIELRRIAGMDYSSQARSLEYFDAFLVKQGWSSSRITHEITDSYQKELERLKPGGRQNRFSVVRQFCEYLSRTDPFSYVPEHMRGAPSFYDYEPYIFSLEQIQKLMAATSSLRPSNGRPQAYRTLLGLLYSTGIRIGEALSLNIGNFYEAEERIYIVRGKFGKARWIPLSSSTCRALQEYVKLRRLRAPRSSASPLFLNDCKRRFDYKTVSWTFRGLLKRCDISHNKHIGPRLHSIRHSFAVHRLLAWYRDGKDVNARLPQLATYMGHANIDATRIYLRPTAELLGEVSNRFRQHYLNHIDPNGGNS